VLAFRDLPPPQPGTTVALLGLAVLLWFWARIQIVRRHVARGGAADEVPRTPAWLVRLSARRWIQPLLGVLALAFGMLLAAGLR